MSTFFQRLLLQNWQRKGISIILAIVVWLLVDHSLMTTKTIDNVSVRVVNIPKNKTLEGIQSHGLMLKKVPISLVGKKSLLDELSPSDFEVVIDAKDQPDEFIVTLTKKNLVSLNPEINLQSGITRIYHQNFIIRMATEKTSEIPVYINVTGEPPDTYQFLDYYPWRLTLSLTGPETEIEQLKQGVYLPINLENIKKSDIDAIEPHGNVVTYFLPEQAKFVSVPGFAEKLEIDDPAVKFFRLEFLKAATFAINAPLPVSIYFPPNSLSTFNPETVQIGESKVVLQEKSLFQTAIPLYAKNVSKSFLDTVSGRMEITIIPRTGARGDEFNWSLQFIGPAELEERYLRQALKDKNSNELRELAAAQKEEYLRAQFRNFVRRIRLYTEGDKELKLAFTSENGKLIIQNPPSN